MINTCSICNEEKEIVLIENGMIPYPEFPQGTEIIFYCQSCIDKLSVPDYEPPNCYIPGEGWRVV